LLQSLNTEAGEKQSSVHPRDEWALANHCLLLACHACHGFSLGRQQLQALALQFCKQRGCYALTKGLLGQHSVDGFLKCNSPLAIHKAEGLSQARAIGLNAAVVDRWFNEQGNFLQSKMFLTREIKSGTLTKQEFT